MSEWGPWCLKCGHPAGYHTTSLCLVQAGGERKRYCDCDGYSPFIAELKPDQVGEPG